MCLNNFFMKDVGYYLRYVDIALGVILIILLVYAIYTGWIFLVRLEREDEILMTVWL